MRRMLRPLTLLFLAHCVACSETSGISVDGLVADELNGSRADGGDVASSGYDLVPSDPGEFFDLKSLEPDTRRSRCMEATICVVALMMQGKVDSCLQELSASQKSQVLQIVSEAGSALYMYYLSCGGNREACLRSYLSLNYMGPLLVCDNECDGGECPGSWNCEDSVLCLLTCDEPRCTDACWADVPKERRKSLSDLYICVVNQCSSGPVPDLPACFARAVNGPCLAQWADCGGCVPLCSGRVCGPDWCGGTCGSCADGMICNEYQGTCDIPSTGCESSSSPGCGGCSCEEEVCTADPLSCSTSWDEPCVALCSACTA
jgi:hypothetical protein